MEVLEAIKSRRSIRKYLNAKKVPFEILAEILEAGNHAPSSGNLQSWKFIVVEGEEKIAKVTHACFEQIWIKSAPVLIVVCAFTSKVKRAYGIRGELIYSPQECGMAIQNMCLAAENFGLSTCIVGAFDEADLSTVLEIPQNVRPQTVLTLGYADEIVPTPAKIPTREVTYFEIFGQKKKEFKVLPLSKSFKEVKENIKRSNVAKKLKSLLSRK